MPLIPNGSQAPPPPGTAGRRSGFVTFVHSAKSSLPEKIAAMKKNARTAIDEMVMTTVNRIVASMPTMLIPTKMT